MKPKKDQEFKNEKPHPSLFSTFNKTFQSIMRFEVEDFSLDFQLVRRSAQGISTTIISPAIKSELRHPTEYLVLKMLLPQSFSLLPPRRKMIKFFLMFSVSLTILRSFRGHLCSWLGKKTFLVQHATEGGYGTMLQQSSPEDKIPPAGVFPAAVCSGTSLIPQPSNAMECIQLLPSKKPVADHRRNL